MRVIVQNLEVYSLYLPVQVQLLGIDTVLDGS